MEGIPEPRPAAMPAADPEPDVPPAATATATPAAAPAVMGVPEPTAAALPAGLGPSGAGPALPPTLTVAGLRARIDKKSTAEDALLLELLEAAFAQAGEPPPYGCGRLLVAPSSPTTRTFRLRWRRIVVPDASAITAVTVAGETVSEYHSYELDGYVVGMEFSDAIVRPGFLPTVGWAETPLPTGYQQNDRSVAVTALFGFTSIPPNLNEAIYLLAARMYYEKEAQFADQVAVGEGATAQIYYRQLPPRARLAFESFAIPQAVAGLA